LPKKREPRFQIPLPKPFRKRSVPFDMHLFRNKIGRAGQGTSAVWLTDIAIKNISDRGKKGTWWWLPPVIWPDSESEIQTHVRRVLQKGARNFVLNAPWQMSLLDSLEGLNVWAGPFCNIANSFAVESMKTMGFSGAVISPELGREDIIRMPESSPLPLGIVIEGNWPMCISRFLSEDMAGNHIFTSPKGEQAWVSKHGHGYWIYPNWRLDMTSRKDMLRRAGYTLFIAMHEPLPRGVVMKKREGLWNWKVGLK
jgi:putative protease